MTFGYNAFTKILYIKTILYGFCSHVFHIYFDRLRHKTCH